MFPAAASNDRDPNSVDHHRLTKPFAPPPKALAFSSFLFDTDWMGREVYGGKAGEDAYAAGVRAGEDALGDCKLYTRDWVRNDVGYHQSGGAPAAVEPRRRRTPKISFQNHFSPKISNSRFVASSLRLCSGMGLPVGKHYVPDKPLPMNDELVWDNDTPFPEPCIDRIADTVGKALESSPQPQQQIVTDPSSSGNAGSSWDDFSDTDIFSDEEIEKNISDSENDDTLRTLMKMGYKQEEALIAIERLAP
ncbi:uncharacterized protein LOC109811208 [Cajanus cajan]|uniref:uncharacterized protein LOC109811208 n=1 Tax=Cajanus cajan TaxID=3821 RepID=UPI0010FBBB8E|nr:uncharacterized protein LOC109811208 [Cajanus cajan]